MKLIRIICIEDSIQDLLLLKRSLKQAGLVCEFLHLVNLCELEPVSDQNWDLILTDYQLPSFTAIDVISVVTKLQKNIPIIVYSGAIREENAVDLLRLGAKDFVRKDNPSRLVPAILREVQELEQRRARLLAEESLKKSQQRSASQLQKIFDSLPIFAGFLNEKGMVTFVNQSAVDVIAATKEEVIGKYFWECTWWKGLPQARTKIQSALAKAFRGDSQRFDMHYISVVSGVSELRWADYAMTPFSGESGKIEAVTVTGFDITERIDQAKELARAKVIAENANSAKSAFLANMSHEIRTPLGAILGFTDVLKTSSPNKEERDHYLEIIHRNGEALIKIIDDILDLSKIEAGKLEIERSPICISELIISVIEMFRDRAAEKGISIVLENAQFPKFKIASDAVRIRQVLINLIGNAVKFTSHGGIRVSGKYDEGPGKELRVRIIVKDSGIGMSAEQASRLFLPFSQGDNRSNRVYGGTGLGLALSKKLGQALGGGVSLIEFKENGGCSFQFDLVAEKCLPGKVEWIQPVEKQIPKLPERLQGLKVLVVDDSTDNRLLVQHLLKREGASVEEAINGEQALEMALKRDYDTILLDIQMPGLDGYQVLTKLKNKSYRKPVIALTAHAMKEERNRALAAGFSAHVAKPVNSSDLVQSILDFSKS